ncbi:RNA-directed DNA polymerase, eukaryota [Tanacetum coccineum]
MLAPIGGLACIPISVIATLRFSLVVDLFIPAYFFISHIKKYSLHSIIIGPSKPYIAKSAAPSNSFASVLKEGHVSVNNSEPAIVLDESCMKVHDFNLSLMGKVKNVSTIPNLPVLIAKEGFQNIKLDYLGGCGFSLLSSRSPHMISSWIILVLDHGLPIKAWTPNSFKKIASCWGELVEWEDSGHNSFSCKHLCLKTRMDVIINDKRKLIVQGKAFWIRVKELDAWSPDFEEDNDDDVSSDEEEPKGNNSQNFDASNDVDRVSESSFMHEMDHVINSVHVDSTHRNVDEDKPGENAPQSEDPFGIYDLLKNNHHQSSCNSESVDPLFPPGFTPRPLDQEKLEEVNPKGIDECVQSLSNKLRASKKHGTSSINSSNSGSFKRKAGGLGIKAKRRWINELCHKHRINFVSLQETKAEAIDLCSIKECWGNLHFDHIVGPSVGNSGGIACIWDPNMFTKDHVSISDYFVALMGTWIPSSSKLLIISVYAPQELSEKRALWDYLHLLISRWDGETVLMGDFNEVRSERERFGSVFNQQGANVFNHFITSNGLIDPPLDGYAFTWTHKSASKMSKLGRFLFSEGLLESFPHLSAICLDKHLSDHRPILLRETSFDYGPTPFWFFHSWFTMEGFDSFVESTWNSFNIVEENGLIRLKKKL